MVCARSKQQQFAVLYINGNDRMVSGIKREREDKKYQESRKGKEKYDRTNDISFGFYFCFQRPHL